LYLIGSPGEKIVDGRKYAMISYHQDLAPIERIARLVAAIVTTIFTVFIGLFLSERIKNFWTEAFTGQKKIDVEMKVFEDETNENLNNVRINSIEESKPKALDDDSGTEVDFIKKDMTNNAKKEVLDGSAALSVKETLFEKIELLLEDEDLKISFESEEKLEERLKSLKNSVQSPPVMLKIAWIRCVQNNKEKLRLCLDWISRNGNSEFTDFIKKLSEKSTRFTNELNDILPRTSSKTVESIKRFNLISIDFRDNIAKLKAANQ
jgi:hypothetical protein